jgi:photosystem II stability/assembly factor-like uncharacterized protein
MLILSADGMLLISYYRVIRYSAVVGRLSKLRNAIVCLQGVNMRLLRFAAIGFFACGAPSSAASAWVNVGNGVPSPLVLETVTDQSLVIAGTNGGGLYESTDGGASWQRLGTGAGSDAINNMTTRILIDPADHNVIYECGIYGSDACKSTDGGATFHYLPGGMSHNDDMSVDFKDPQRKTILISHHETQQAVYKSTDAGQTWTNIGVNIPSSYNFAEDPLIIDSMTYLVGCSGWANVGGVVDSTGVFRTTDGGSTWKVVCYAGANSYPLVTSKGVVYYALIYSRGLIMSLDTTGSRWSQRTGYGVIQTVPPVQLPDNRFVAASVATNGLVASKDAANWVNIGPRTSATVTSVVYNTTLKAFFVVAGGIYRLDYDSVVTETKEPVAAPRSDYRQRLLQVAQNRITIPAEYGPTPFVAAVYTSDGRIVGNFLVRGGQSIALKSNSARAVRFVRLLSVPNR